MFALIVLLGAAAQSPKFPVGGVFTALDPNNTRIALSFDSTGRLDVYVDNQAFGQSTWQVNADTITFGAVTAPEGYGCPSSAKYLWSLADDRLSFTMVGNDDCSPRRDPLTGLAWKKG
jgi:hypothetical protein